MANPVPTDAQWLILYQVDEGDVLPDGVGRWKAKGAIGYFSATGAIKRLWQLGLINLTINGVPRVTPEGQEVLQRRSVYEVLERTNRRRGNAQRTSGTTS